MSRVARDLQMTLPIVSGHTDAYDLVSLHFAGQDNIVKDHWIPQCRDAGINFVFLAVAGDRKSMLGGSERPLHAALEITDMVLSEFESLTDPDVSIIVDAAGIAEARSRVTEGHVAFVLSLEGGRPLQRCLGHLRIFHRLGFRYFQVTHNIRNELGDGSFEEETRGGLSRFGREVVREVNRLGMVLDLSHISHTGFRDAIELTEGPVMVSHANARAVWDHPRNFDDAELRALAARGGVIGILYSPDFIGHHFEPIDGVMAHLNHIVSVIGIDHVGIAGLGTDERQMEIFIDAPWPYERNAQILAKRPKGLYREAQYEKLIQAMLDQGYTEGQIGLVLGGNYLRVLGEALG